MHNGETEGCPWLGGSTMRGAEDTFERVRADSSVVSADVRVFALEHLVWIFKNQQILLPRNMIK